MNQKISIPVAASLDTSSVEQAVNAMGQRIAQANRVQYQPVSTKTVEDVKRLNSALNEVVKTQTGLRKRLKDTGQESKPFTEWDWPRMYPHAASRGAAMQGVFERVVGGDGPRFTALPTAPAQNAPHAPPGQRREKPSPGASMAAGVAQAGLRAAGPAGGVAASAVGTGMSAGFGAGLMGLAGGLAALSVSKVIGAVAEKMDQAERNNIEYDKLKRILGDVGVSFGALKGVVHASSENLKITYEEAGRLSTQFAKLANLSGNEFKTLPDELDTGVGLSRSMGLDPSIGVGALGQMRGLGITTNSQDSRRFALLIGETIGKSNAFAKAEEVFEAIGGYASTQTRNSMGAANVAGYAGMYSGMVGSGIPGMDPAGAAGLLSKINSTLAAGGAKGEASQFFTGIVGHRMGLDPIQTQILREGGAFATNDEAFGKGSVAAKFGIDGPSGDKTFLQGSLDELRSQYGNNKGLLAQATANHLGVGMRQAMALLSVEPNQMGEMQDYAGDLTKISGSGITNLSKSLYGTAQERRSLADNYLARRGSDAISEDDRKKLEAASGSDEALKQALASMAAKYDQERTTGSDIRDSKNALDNIKTSLADKLVPIALEMRHGIMLLAGGGKKSPQEIMKEVLELESKDRTRNISGQFGAKSDPLLDRLDHLQNKERSLDPVALAHTYRDKPEVLVKKLNERADVQREIVEVEEKLTKLSKDKAKALEAEAAALREKLQAVKNGGMTDPSPEKASLTTGDFARMDRRPGAEPSAGGGRGSGAGYDPLRSDRKGAAPSAPAVGTASSLSDISDPDQRKNLKAFLDTIAASEGAKDYNTLVGGGRIDDLSDHPNEVGLVTGDGPSTAFGRYQITGSTWYGRNGKPGLKAKLGLKDFSPESQDKAAVELLRQRGALDDVLSGNFKGAVGKLGNEWQSLPSGTSRHQGKRTWDFFDRTLSKALQSEDAVKPNAKTAPPTVATKPETTPAPAQPKSAPPVATTTPAAKKADLPPVPTPAKAEVPAAVKPLQPAKPDLPPVPAQPPRGKDGTPAASMGMQTESSYKPGAVTSAPLAQLSGEANVTVDLSPDARRLLATPAAPMSMRLGPATPLGLKAPASMRQ